jgi:hypothetical protein
LFELERRQKPKALLASAPEPASFSQDVLSAFQHNEVKTMLWSERD